MTAAAEEPDPTEEPDATGEPDTVGTGSLGAIAGNWLEPGSGMNQFIADKDETRAATRSAWSQARGTAD
ncbi:MAG: hypothetical protein JSS27_03205 [Planctomycetes bacterium]|nr:hypothetical protein [Planctomycetota bacterium]